MNYVIRKKSIGDCEDIAHVITLAWQQTYRGIVDDEFLNELSLNEKDRIKIMRKEFDENNNNTIVLEVSNKIVGFITYDKSDYENYTHCGEINALYIINDYIGQEYGKKLFFAALDELKKIGFDSIIVGCLEGNKSNTFYKHLGGEKIGIRYIEKGKQKLVENIYYFKKI